MDKDFNTIPYSSYVHNGFTHSRNIFDLWSDEDLAAIGAYRVIWGEVPEGKEVVEWKYKKLKNNIKATPVLEDIKTPVPQTVTKAQGKAALLEFGVYEGVVSYIESLPDREKILALIAFSDTNEWQRQSPFLTQCAVELGLSEEDLDNLFLLASEIVL